MTITLNGTTGITTPAVTNNGAYTGDGISFADGTPSNTLVTDTSGNVCVGSTAAGNAGAINVSVGLAGTTAGGIQLWSNTTASHSIQWGDGTSSTDPYRGYIEYAHNGDSMRFATTSTERMRIDSSGNLLVGTTSSTAKTDIYRTTSGDVLALQNTNNGTHANITSRRAGTSGYAIYFECSGSQAGTITHPTTTSTNYGSGSDYRLKDNVRPLDNALNIVSQLKPSKWNWKTDNSEDSGFIAHELQEIFPSAVTGKKDDVDAGGNPIYQCVDTSFLVATLTAAIQEQQAIITSQASAITALEARLTALENK